MLSSKLAVIFYTFYITDPAFMIDRGTTNACKMHGEPHRYVIVYCMHNLYRFSHLLLCMCVFYVVLI